MRTKINFILLEKEHAERIANWNKGKEQSFLEQWAGTAFHTPLTTEQILIDAKTRKGVFAIILNDKMIGTIALSSLDEHTGSGHIGHFMLDPSLTGQGYGAKVLHEFILYCFGILKIKELTLRVFEYNKGAIQCYKKSGFIVKEEITYENGSKVFLMELENKGKLYHKDVDPKICEEAKDDWRATELMTQHAFWNLHWPGCNEHLLVSNLRESRDYIPRISKIAKDKDAVVGAILYSKAYVLDQDQKKHEVLTFGPLCVEPEYQSLGVGGKLLMTTMEEAKKAGYSAIIIFGEPGYYPRFGFQTCDHFKITTPEEDNFDAFMGIELVPGAVKDISGKFYEADVFGDRPQEEVDAYDRLFPALVKCKLPGQWN